MFDLLLSFKNLSKFKSLRICNIIGLSLLFGCFAVSYEYIKYELSYDKFYTNADRIVRLSLIYNDKPSDVRIYGNKIDDVLKTVPDIEHVAKMRKVETADMKYAGEQKVLTDFYLVSDNFFDIFDIPVVFGSKVFNKQSMAVSENFALKYFGTTDVVDKEVRLASRRFGEQSYFISCVFKSMPENSHFHSDLFLGYDHDQDLYNYVYLLLKKGVDVKEFENDLNQHTATLFPNDEVKPAAILMPLTDIHLHSHYQREHEANGNINYLYLLAASCMLLFIIVLFNLWLTNNIMFQKKQPYYRMLYVNGGGLQSIFRQELYSALITGLLSVVTGGVCLSVFMQFTNQSGIPHLPALLIPALVFLALQTFIALLPVLKKYSFSFLTEQEAITGGKFTYRKARYMLAAQFCIVIFTGVLSFGIVKQLKLINSTQLAGNMDNIIVFKEQSDGVIAKYELLKSELLKHPEISAVTAGMQLPGSAIRDGARFRVEGSDQEYGLPILIADNDMFKCYDINFIAGDTFPDPNLTYDEEFKILINYMEKKEASSNLSEGFVINEQAAKQLGFDNAGDAVGKLLDIKHGEFLAYIPKGEIIGVTEDFVYTNVYEKTEPMVIMQRMAFMSCFAIKYDKQKETQALDVVKKVWHDVNPDHECNYTYLNDEYGKIYANEYNISRSVSAYSVICLVLANLGLIVFMAFMTKTRKKEISIRKINGASVAEILKLLNTDFMTGIIAGFIIAIPLSYYVLTRWLQNFAYKINVGWYIFALIGLIAMFFVFTSAGSRAYKAATANPADSLKSD